MNNLHTLNSNGNKLAIICKKYIIIIIIMIVMKKKQEFCFCCPLHQAPVVKMKGRTSSATRAAKLTISKGNWH